MSRIDSVDVTETDADIPDGFVILKSGTGSFSGMIPPDIAICDDCIADIFTPGGRYEGYWATSCVNCGPRYSIITGDPVRPGADKHGLFSHVRRMRGGVQATRTPGATMHRRSPAAPAAPGSGSWIQPGPMSRASTRSVRQRHCSMPGRSSRSGASGGSILPASRSPRANSNPASAGSSSRSR